MWVKQKKILAINSNSNEELINIRGRLKCILSIINKPSIFKYLISIEEGENYLSADE